jgi:hypothetical protein
LEIVQVEEKAVEAQIALAVAENDTAEVTKQTEELAKL